MLAFLRACGVAAWLEYRNLRYYPSNLALAGVQELTAVGVWYFTARFLDAGASASVAQYGGNYLAYVVVGVLLNQICLAALDGPFTTISDAFWDKRLETYRLSIHGIWANLLGRLSWDVGFSLALQGVALVVLLLAGGLGLHAGINVPLVLLGMPVVDRSQCRSGHRRRQSVLPARGQERPGSNHLGLSLSGDAGERSVCASLDPARLAASHWQRSPANVWPFRRAGTRAHRRRRQSG